MVMMKKKNDQRVYSVVCEVFTTYLEKHDRNYFWEAARILSEYSSPWCMQHSFLCIRHVSLLYHENVKVCFQYTMCSSSPEKAIF